MPMVVRMLRNGWLSQNSGRSKPPGTIETFTLSTTTAEEEFLLVQRTNDHPVVIPVTEAGSQDVRIAALRATDTQVLVASLSTDCKIEGPGGSDTVSLQQSTPAQYHWLRMRQGDGLQFPSFDYNLTINYETIDKRPRVHASQVSPRPPTPDDIIDQIKVMTSSSTETEEEVKKNVSADNIDERDSAAVPGQIDNYDGSELPQVPDSEDYGMEVYSTARDDGVTTAKQTTPSSSKPTNDAGNDGISETPIKRETSADDVEPTHLEPQLSQASERIPTLNQNGISRPPSQASASTKTSASPRPLKRKLQVEATSPGTTRKTPRRSAATPRASQSAKAVLLTGSKFKDDKEMSHWLRDQGYTIYSDLPKDSVAYICVVGEGDLKPTIKLLRSMVTGRAIVTDTWLELSKDKNHVLDTTKYLHPAVSQELVRSDIFKGLTIVVTPKEHKRHGTGWSEVEGLLRAAGARKVEHKSSRKWQKLEDTKSMLFVAMDDSDEDGKQIAHNTGAPVFHKDIIIQSILRGELLKDDESLRLDYGSPA